jgi:uncharacterized damage-inducible protein DinB
MAGPYAEHVGDRDPVAMMAETVDVTRALLSWFTPEQWKRSYAAGKWTAQQILVHVVQAELVFGLRIRHALAEPGYVVQPFDQDAWVALEGDKVDGPTALLAFEGIRCMNLALCKSLTRPQRQATFRHPERGELRVEDILVMMAGHEVHHLQQFREIA